MLFDFHLCPLEKVQPWGQAPNQSLSWFSLTEGFYRLQVGSTYLLNYSDESVDHQIKALPDCYPGPFVEYYVVRLWEDILDMLPAVLESLPEELSQLFETTDTDWFEWRNRAIDWVDDQPDEDRAMEVFDLATTWQDSRRLNSGYLKNSPGLWIWSQGQFVILSWDSVGIEVEGIPVWTAKRGHYRMTREVFLAELQAFHHRLMSEMSKRVKTICEGYVHPDIHIDTHHLKLEQTDRGTWLSHALNKTSITAWNEVMDAISISIGK